MYLIKNVPDKERTLLRTYLIKIVPYGIIKIPPERDRVRDLVRLRQERRKRTAARLGLGLIFRLTFLELTTKMLDLKTYPTPILVERVLDIINTGQELCRALTGRNI